MVRLSISSHPFSLSQLSADLALSPFPLSRLPKIKAWIDENNPGDQLLPFSVALEERLVSLSFEEQGEELEKLGLAKATALGTTPGLGKMSVRQEEWRTGYGGGKGMRRVEGDEKSRCRGMLIGPRLIPAPPPDTRRST